jgi:dTDP-4-dehydrorhamnose reductase
VEKAVADANPDVIFICSAWPYVDGCERDPQESERQNVSTTANLIAATKGSQARIVYYSTDYVFDGGKPEYVETDPVSPLGVYARHKRRSEELLLDRGRSLIARIAWVFGEELRRKNFVYRVIEQARAGKPLLVPEKQSGCPTWSRWVADCTLNLLDRSVDGVVHLTGNELVTKAEWARLIAKALQLPPLEIREVTSAESGQVAPRPMSVRLVSRRHQERHPPLSTILESERAHLISG